MRARTGFTVVEITIVVLLIGLLAAVAIPNFIKARTDIQKYLCINNLRMIEAAKEQWALMNNEGGGARQKGKKGNPRRNKKNPGDPVNESEVNALLKHGAPHCPAGGSYTYGGLRVIPRCSLGREKGHVLL